MNTEKGIGNIQRWNQFYVYGTFEIFNKAFNLKIDMLLCGGIDLRMMTMVILRYFIT